PALPRLPTPPPPPTPTPSPYTTLFRSPHRDHLVASRQPSERRLPAGLDDEVRHHQQQSAAARDGRHPLERGGQVRAPGRGLARPDRKSTRLNSSHVKISYAVFCLKKKK